MAETANALYVRANIAERDLHSPPPDQIERDATKHLNDLFFLHAHLVKQVEAGVLVALYDPHTRRIAYRQASGVSAGMLVFSIPAHMLDLALFEYRQRVGAVWDKVAQRASHSHSKAHVVPHGHVDPPVPRCS